MQTARWSEDGEHFLIRSPPQVRFCPALTQAAVVTSDAQGRGVGEEWGWLGAESNRARRLVRRLTLTRPGAEASLLLTDLLDTTRYPAAALLTGYLARWGSERVFEQIPEVCALRRLLGSTPPAPVCQAAFCLLLYNMVQVLRGDIALAQPHPCPAEPLSTEPLFYDVQRELTAVRVLVAPSMVVAVYPEELAQAELRQRVPSLLAAVWTPRWHKAVKTQPRSKIAQAKRSGAHTSVHRWLQAAHQASCLETARA